MSRLLFLLLTLVIFPSARLQLLDYEYVDEVPEAVPEIPEVLRMPVSDISNEQRAELSMIAANSEPFFNRPRIDPSTVIPLSSIWSRTWPKAAILSTLPSTTATTEAPLAKSGLLSVVGSNVGNNPEKSFAALLKSLPDPAVLLSVDKLFSSFKNSGGDLGGETILPSTDGSQLNTLFPNTAVFGVKSDNGNPEEEEEPAEGKTSTGSSFGAGETSGLRILHGKAPIDMTTVEPVSTPDAGDSLLSSLLQGRLGEIDWIGSLLGTKQTPSKEEGNAIADIFKGGFFGPADGSAQDKELTS